jgi:hypothetical protein
MVTIDAQVEQLLKSELRSGEELKEFSVAVAWPKPSPFGRYVVPLSLPVGLAVTFIFGTPLVLFAALFIVLPVGLVLFLKEYKHYVLGVTNSGLLLVQVGMRFKGINPGKKIGSRSIPFDQVTDFELHAEETPTGKPIWVHLKGGETLELKIPHRDQQLTDSAGRMTRLLDLLNSAKAGGKS